LATPQWKVTIKQIIMWLLVDEILRSFVIATTDPFFNVTWIPYL
jgi:hypothetical protein